MGCPPSLGLSLGYTHVDMGRFHFGKRALGSMAKRSRVSLPRLFARPSEAGNPGDRERALALLDESLAISSQLGMQPLMERVLSRRDILKA